jgi:hypothetical protein
MIGEPSSVPMKASDSDKDLFTLLITAAISSAISGWLLSICIPFFFHRFI